MRKRFKTLLICLVMVQFTGCSIFTLNGLAPGNMLKSGSEKISAAYSSNDKSSSEARVLNPPARTLRFDGHEIVLGESENQAMETGTLRRKLEPLIQSQKFQTAATFILNHREAAERLLIETWASEADDAVLQLCAEVLSQRSSSLDKSWVSLLRLAKSQGAVASQYQSLRNGFADELRSNDPSNGSAEQLMQASLKVNHPLVRVDAFRLLGLRELVAGRHAWAESQFRQSIDVALSSGHPLMAAELWLTVAESARRNNQASTAATAWTNAVRLQLSSAKPDHPVDVGFWLLADKTRPESTEWPVEIARSLGSKVEEIGCSSSGGSEMVLWASVAQSQFERGELQVALVNFKKAETVARADNSMWLRIAQAKCLAGMGQSPAAAALLSGPAASPEVSIASAAMATMGSIKLQAGAFQQGAQLLHKALGQSTSAEWPSMNQSRADLAIAQLIIGDTESGLQSLHEAQSLLEQSGERAQLIQSLENELRLMEHENRGRECLAIKAKISQLESFN